MHIMEPINSKTEAATPTTAQVGKAKKGGLSPDQDSPTMKLIRSELDKCISCGNCLHHCPVFSQQPEEKLVARGRNLLLKQINGDIAAVAPDLAECLSKCLLCGACTEACPQGVNNALITIAARGDLVQRHGLSLTKSFAFRTVLKNRATMRRALKMAEKAQKLLPVSNASGRPGGAAGLEQPGKVRHLPSFLAGMHGGRHLPSLAPKSLSELLPEDNPPAPGSNAKDVTVAFFSGCAAEFCFPPAAQALVDNITRLGARVVFPKAQGCCGLPVRASGDLETAAEMAVHNLEVLDSFSPDFVVTGCATCGSHLKKGWVELARNESEKKRFEELSRKVRDASELMQELANYAPPRCSSLLPPGVKVTYHNPCHLVRHQQVRQQPRSLLRQVFGDNFVELDNNGCCGCGGSFNLTHYPLSQKIGREKIDSIERSGADVVITSCPGCTLQLVDGIKRRGLDCVVVDLMEAIVPVKGE